MSRYTPEPRRTPGTGEYEIRKGTGTREAWFYVSTPEDARRLVRLGRNWYYPTGITRKGHGAPFFPDYKTYAAPVTTPEDDTGPVEDGDPCAACGKPVVWNEARAAWIHIGPHSCFLGGGGA